MREGGIEGGREGVREGWREGREVRREKKGREKGRNGGREIRVNSAKMNLVPVRAKHFDSQSLSLLSQSSVQKRQLQTVIT